jgi:hypothetical protein
MNLCRLAVRPVDRDHVLRAGRHDHDAVNCSAQRHKVSRFAEWLAPDDLAIGADRDVHPQVQRSRAVGRAKTQLRQGSMQIVSTIVMILPAP